MYVAICVQINCRKSNISVNIYRFVDIVIVLHRYSRDTSVFMVMWDAVAIVRSGHPCLLWRWLCGTRSYIMTVYTVLLESLRQLRCKWLSMIHVIEIALVCMKYSIKADVIGVHNYLAIRSWDRNSLHNELHNFTRYFWRI